MMNRIVGDIDKIDLGTSSFRRMIENNNLYIDKTEFIEHFITEQNQAQLIVRQRRIGKSLNLDMLRCFLTDKEGNAALFKGLYIENSPVWNIRNTAPIFYFDFKSLTIGSYKKQIFNQIAQHIWDYIDVDQLKGFQKKKAEAYLDDDYDNVEGILLLTELVYRQTGKYSYILIDEYDKLLTDNYQNEAYEEIKKFETQLFSAGLKGNGYLEKALLTGVMRVSRESILSGLNNLQTYDLFSDTVYTNDFGITEREISQLNKTISFNKEEVKEWYNGIKINDVPIYNIYSVMSFLQKKQIDNYWGRSGTIDIISNLMNDERINAIAALINKETITTPISHRISLQDLLNQPSDGIFYSLLTQTGYLTLEKLVDTSTVELCIPNRELMNVWKEFILSNIVKESSLQTLFSNVSDLDLFSQDVNYFISDRLSYYDIGIHSDTRTQEKIYHIFVLGILSAYNDVKYNKFPKSNRESGNGRYDIFFEREGYSIIFEFKSVADTRELETKANEALKQIDDKRYFAEIPNDKPLIKTAIVFCGKKCYVKSVSHQW